MDAPPRISVVMPVYNAERYLRAAVESILNQTFRDFELLVFDDGSTDGTIPMLEQYAAADPRIVLFREQHRGYAHWLNEGLRRARGAFYARMDADDIADPERFRLQVEHLDQHPDCVAVGAEAQYIDPDGWPIAPLRVPLAHEQIEAALLEGHGHSLVHPVAMFRRAAMEQIGGYRRQYETAEDLDLYLRLAEVGRLANLPQTLLQYRRHATSVSHARHEHQMATVTAILIEAYQRRGIDRPAPVRRSATAGAPEAAHWLRWTLQASRAGHWATAGKYLKAIALRHPIQATLFAVRAGMGWVMRRIGVSPERRHH